MIISIVNSKEKNIKYEILDKSPELNFSIVTDNTKITLTNKFSKYSYTFSDNELNEYFEFNPDHYNIYVNDFCPSSYLFDEDSMINIANQIYFKVRQTLDPSSMIKFDGKDATSNDYIIKVSDNTFTINSITFIKNFYPDDIYNKTEVNDLLLKLVEKTNTLNNLEEKILNIENNIITLRNSFQSNL